MLKMCKKKAAWRTKTFCLMWKIFKYKRHHWFLTCVECWFPVALVLLYVSIIDHNGNNYFDRRKNTRHFKEHYLLSSGLSLWLQSEICSNSGTPQDNYGSEQLGDPEQIIFNPICPFDNSQSLDCFVEWYNKAFKNAYHIPSIHEVTNSICPPPSQHNNDGPRPQPRIQGPKSTFDNIKGMRYENDHPINDPCHKLVLDLLGYNQIILRVLLGKILYTPNDKRASKILEKVIEQNFRTFLNQKDKLEESNNQEIVDKTLTFIDCISTDRLEAVTDESAILERAKVLYEKNEFLAAVIFHFSKDSDDLPPYLNYTIRTNDQLYNDHRNTVPRAQDYSPIQPETTTVSVLLLVIQDMIDNAFIQLSSSTANKSLIFPLSLKQVSQPCYTDHERIIDIIGTFPQFFIVLSFLLSFGITVSQIVQEKESHMKEFMLVMSMKPHQYWTSWYVSNLLWWFFIFLPALILLFNATVLSEYVNEFLLFLIIIIFMMATVAQALAVSTFFNSESMTIIVSGLLYFLLVYVGMMALLLKDDISWGTMAFLSLFPQTGFIIGMHFFIRTVNPLTADIATWSKLSFDHREGQLACVMLIFLFIDIVVYFLLTLYLDAIFPGSSGIGQDWCFCLCDFFDLSKKLIGKVLKMLTSTAQSNSENYTTLDTGNNGSNGVNLNGVTKAFHSQQQKLIAVNNISLQFSPNEISVLLGQNGAGKTTLFSMIIGSLAATKGSIYVEGKNISEQPKEAREIIGFCPQTNTLFPNLTVKEHIWFFWTLKAGQYPSENDITKILSMAKIEEFQYVSTKTLSGGTKRKLSICLAFCGNTKVVLLDEPTSGVDPSSRRAIWNVLENFKEGRTIIMSTHIMEEADAIGDKIAIIDLGILKVFDTPVHLKQQFAQFYKLVVALADEHTLSMVDKLVTDIYGKGIYKTDGQEIEFSLPNKGEKDVNKLIQVLATLEKQPQVNFGLRSSGIEDVFLASIENVKSNSEEEVNKLLRLQVAKTNATKYLQHAYALLVKRFHNVKRDFWSPIANFLLPVIVIVMVLLPFIATFKRSLSREPEDWKGQTEYSAKELSPHIFQHHNKKIYFPYANNVQKDQLKEFLFGQSGLGSLCNLHREHSHSEKICSAAPTQIEIKEFQAAKPSSNGCNCCNCGIRGRICSEDGVLKYADSFSSLQLASGEVLLNLNGQSMQQYFLDTERYGYKTRYGGLEITSTNFTTDNILNHGNSALIDYVLRIWFDGRETVSGPAYLNGVNNAILQTLCSDGTCGISTSFKFMPSMGYDYSHPDYYDDGNTWLALLTTRSRERGPDSQNEPLDYLNGFILPPFLLLSLSVISTFWTMPYITENLRKLKLLLYLEGLLPVTYWAMGCLTEYLLYIVYCAILLIILLELDLRPFTKSENIGQVIALIFLFGFANIPLSGLLSLFVKTGVQLFSFMIVSVFLAIGLGEYVLFTRAVGRERQDYPQTGDPRTGRQQMEDNLEQELGSLISAFAVLPHFCLFNGLSDIGGNSFTNLGPGARNKADNKQYLGKYYFALIAVGVAAFVLILLLENWRHLSTYCQQLVQNKFGATATEKSSNNDVHEGNALQVEGLEKSYSTMCSTVTVAVIGISFSVKQNTCFGLLGMNGAGKTTVLKVLTGEILPSAGSIAWQRKSGRQLGYCPQFDTHDPFLTPEEIMFLHCRIHNYPEKDIPTLVSKLLKNLDLSGYKDIISKNLSGGTNRRLSAGVAFLGAPNIVLLDEPSTGLDPVARRRIWNLVKYPASSDQAFILVSHIMEECEALCDLVGIMVKGKFICKGTPQQLKSKFGSKYIVMIDKLRLGDTWNAQEWVNSELPVSTIKEETNSFIELSVPVGNMKLSKIFGVLSKLEPVADREVSCYTVSQATLDDVFLKFVKSTEASSTPSDYSDWHKMATQFQ